MKNKYNLVFGYRNVNTARIAIIDPDAPTKIPGCEKTTCVIAANIPPNK